MKKSFQELHDETLISEAGGDMCSVPLEKLRSKAMIATHKKLCVDPKHWSTTDKKSKKSMWSKAAQRAASSGGHRLHNSVEEGYKDLPPHLQKLVKKIEKRQKDWNKQNPKAKIKTLVYNPKTGRPDIEVEEGYQEIQNLANLIKSETDRLVKAAKKGDMKTVMAIYRTIGNIIK